MIIAAGERIWIDTAHVVAFEIRQFTLSITMVNGRLIELPLEISDTLDAFHELIKRAEHAEVRRAVSVYEGAVQRLAASGDIKSPKPSPAATI